MSRYTLTIKYTDGHEEEFEHVYLYTTHDHLDRIREVNEYWHDVASVVIHDSKYGRDDVYELGEVA